MTERKQSFMREEFQQTVINARLTDILNKFGADVDMILLMQIMLDAMDGHLTAGDVAAIYCYRMRLQEK